MRGCGEGGSERLLRTVADGSRKVAGGLVGVEIGEEDDVGSWKWLREERGPSLMVSGLAGAAHDPVLWTVDHRTSPGHLARTPNARLLSSLHITASISEPGKPCLGLEYIHGHLPCVARRIPKSL